MYFTDNIFRRTVNIFRPVAQAFRPGIIRAGVNSYAVYTGIKRRPMFQKMHRQNPERFAPVGVAKILKKPLPPKVADVIYDAAQVTNVLAALGLGHKVVGPLNAALQWWTLTYRNSWGMIFHHDNMMLLHQAVLGVTRSSDAVSLDAVLRDKDLIPEKSCRHYGAIPTAMNIATCSVYFISGVAKVRSPQGWKWASGKTLREQIAADAVRKEVFGSTAPESAAALYNSKAGFGILAAGALVVELGAPLSLLDRRLGMLFAISAWAMHVGIRMVMGIKFTYNTSGMSYLSYIPWALPRSISRLS